MSYPYERVKGFVAEAYGQDGAPYTVRLSSLSPKAQGYRTHDYDPHDPYFVDWYDVLDKEGSIVGGINKFLLDHLGLVPRAE